MYDLIKRYEGCRLKAYKCPAGAWTIGFGSTIYPNGMKVSDGDVCTLAQAEEMLKYHINTECDFIKDMNLTKNQKEAVISLVYNIGKGAFLKSSLYKAIIDKDYKLICKNWDWYSAGGQVLRGLVKRRTEELALFCQDI